MILLGMFGACYDDGCGLASTRAGLLLVGHDPGQNGWPGFHPFFLPWILVLDYYFRIQSIRLHMALFNERQPLESTLHCGRSSLSILKSPLVRTPHVFVLGTNPN